MSFIQDIREKYARWAVVLIALSLLGFILMDAFAGRGSIFSGGPSNTVGKVNGSKIDITAFNKKVLQQETIQQQRQGAVSERDRRNIIDGVWNDMVNKILLDNEAEKLGIKIGKKEINDILFGANPPQDLKSQFTNDSTGQYDAALAQQQINEMKKRGTAEQKSSLVDFVNQLEFQRFFDKYNSMLVNSINFPKWLLEKQNADKSLAARISYVKVNYTDSMFVDSTIKISDKEISEYISKNKDRYKQEENRSVAYVSFSAKPSAADSLEVKEKLLSLKPEFETTTDIQQFFSREGNSDPYYDGYTSGKSIQGADKDSIIAMPVGTIYGPYLDGANFKLAKKIGSKFWPDTVKVRHILVGLNKQDANGQQTPIRDTSAAKKIADSLQLAIRNGSSFDLLCAQFSDDPGSKDKGGVYENVYAGQMVPEFNKFIFDNKTGDKGVVKTDFGYHYIEILSQKGNSSAFQMAYLSRPIIASQETDNTANNAASQFAGNSLNAKAFDENFEKELKPKNIIKQIVPNIKPNDYMVSGLMSRPLVKSIYEADKGDVLQPIRIGEEYIVAAVVEVNNKGTQSVEKARPAVEVVLRNKKKAEQIKQKAGKITTLEAVQNALNKPIETADSLRLSGQASALGFEPRVQGAAFNPDNKGKVIPEALVGVGGVYIVRVESVAATAVESANVAEQQKTMYQNTKQSSMYRFAQILKDAANIKDSRSKFF